MNSLREFLSEAGQEPDEKMGAESLRELVQTARAGQASRRVHIDALVSAAQQVGWPAPARARWEEAATHLDRPRLWPEAGTSSELGAAIGILSRYVTRKLKWRESDPSTTDAIVEGLGEWVPAKLSQGLEKRGAEAGEALGQVVRLAKDVEEDCPSAHVLQLVGVARKSAVPLPQAQAEVAAAERQRPVEVATASSEQVVTELRAELRRLLPVSGAHGKPDVPALRDALRRRDWSGAKGLAANWLAAPPHKWSHQGGRRVWVHMDPPIRIAPLPEIHRRNTRVLTSLCQGLKQLKQRPTTRACPLPARRFPPKCKRRIPQRADRSRRHLGPRNGLMPSRQPVLENREIPPGLLKVRLVRRMGPLNRCQFYLS